MRGTSDQQIESLVALTPEDLVPQEHPIRRIKPLADRVLQELSPTFSRMYAKRGRPSVPPEHLLKASLLIVLYSVRSERQFCEWLAYDMLFRWLLDLNIRGGSFDQSTFAKNRTRLLAHEVTGRFFGAVVSEARRQRLRCREKPYIRAEQLEEPIWSEVKRVLQNLDLIVAGIATLDSQESGGIEEEIAQAERDLRSIQMEEVLAIRLFVSGKITEAQLDSQRKFISERLESARAKLDDYRALEESGTEKRRLMEEVLAWARKFGQGLDEVTPEERHDYLQMLVEQVIIDRDNNVHITLAIPIDDDSSAPDSPDPEFPEPEFPEPECVSIGSQEPSRCGSGCGSDSVPV